MKTFPGYTVATLTFTLLSACTTADKAAVPADTATGSPTTIAPSNALEPAVAPGPVDTMPKRQAPLVNPTQVKPSGSAGTPTKAPVTSTRPRSTTGTTTEPRTQPTEKDSVIRPRATVDANGNIVPIKRDTLR